MLTRKQHELLRFIHERLRESGVPPSFDEMKDALDLKSKSGIHRLITALEERGLHPPPAEPRPGARGHPPARDRRRSRRPAALHAERRRRRARRQAQGRAAAAPTSAAATSSIPVMGRIAAGTPISAIQNRSHSITLSADFLARASITRSRCAATSMVEAGILDGDLVVIRRQDNANTGDIIVALIDDEEATLKRFRRRGSSIALEAANQAYETRVLGPDRVKIQGKLVSLVRRY